MRSAAEPLLFLLLAALIVVGVMLWQGCASAGKIVDYGCKVACGICNTACPLVRDAMESAGGEEEPTPEPTPPPDAGP